MIASTIGAKAMELLKPGDTVQPAGLTSRGLFLRLPSGWIIFLSSEPYRGPLTINIQAEPKLHQQFEGLQAGLVLANGVHFLKQNVTVLMDRANAWHPPQRQMTSFSLQQAWGRLEQIIQRLQPTKSGAGFGKLLPAILGKPVFLEKDQAAALQMIRSLQNGMRSRQFDAIASAVKPLLGYGAGLTPSGDDLIAGLMLTLNRWGDILYRGTDCTHLYQAVCELAYQQTTTLSANLIETAAEGQADERLILSLDGLLTGNPGVEECAAALAGWGASSGIDALCGMLAALTDATTS